MKVLQINSVCGIRSTGRICTDLADVLTADGHDCKIAYGRLDVPERYQKYAVPIGGSADVYAHVLQARLLDSAGWGSRRATRRFLDWVRDYDPDVIHLHNLHGYYINLELLFDYLARADKPVIWTLHDCWAFTGHCAHFASENCQKWQEDCSGCQYKKKYPRSDLLSRSAQNYARKRALAQSVKDLTIVTPSCWLADQVKQSFLGGREICVIPNGVDLSVFRPTESDFRSTYGLEDKRIVLGVATAWSDQKGLDLLLQLSELLGDDYRVVLVGLSEGACKRLPPKVLGIPRTNDVIELAGIYTAADVFVNASREETMGMTTVEAMACGTPVAVSPLTAVPEVVTEAGGLVVPQLTAADLAIAVRQILELRLDPQRDAARYEKNAQFNKYCQLYHRLVEDHGDAAKGKHL